MLKRLTDKEDPKETESTTERLLTQAPCEAEIPEPRDPKDRNDKQLPTATQPKVDRLDPQRNLDFNDIEPSNRALSITDTF